MLDQNPFYGIPENILAYSHIPSHCLKVRADGAASWVMNYEAWTHVYRMTSGGHKSSIITWLFLPRVSSVASTRLYSHFTAHTSGHAEIVGSTSEVILDTLGGERSWLWVVNFTVDIFAQGYEKLLQNWDSGKRMEEKWNSGFIKSWNFVFSCANLSCFLLRIAPILLWRTTFHSMWFWWVRPTDKHVVAVDQFQRRLGQWASSISLVTGMNSGLCTWLKFPWQDSFLNLCWSS